MSHDDHARLREQLLDLAYGELPRRAARRLEKHVAGCEACRAELERIRSTRALMSGLGTVEAPREGESVLLAAAREATRHRQRPAPILPSWMWGGALTAAMLAAVVALTFHVQRLRSPTGLQAEPDALVGPSAPPLSPPVPALEAKREAAAPAAQDAWRSAPAPSGGAPAPAAKLRSPAAQPPAPAVAKPAARAASKADSAEAREAPVAELRDADAHAHADDRREAGRAVANAPSSVAAPAPAPAPPAPPPPAPREPEAAQEAPPAENAPRAEAFAPRRMVANAAPVAKERGGAGAEPSSAGEDPIARHARLRVAGRLAVASRSFTGCPGESFRTVEREQGGATVKLTRHGLARGAPYEVELFYAADGRLAAARYREGSGPVREVRLEGPVGSGTVPAAALAPSSAAEATLDAPPRCAE